MGNFSEQIWGDLRERGHAASAAAAAYSGPRAEQRLGDRDLFWWSAMSRRNRAAVWRFQVVAFSVAAVGLLLLAALG